MEDETVVRINQLRTSGATCGSTAMPPVAPLATNELLRAAARAHSQDMAAQDYFSHTSPDGRSYVDRIQAAGYGGGPYGENIAGGQGSPAAVIGAWMSSASHCQILMSGNFRAAGAGYTHLAGSRYGHYWTLTFGGR